MGFNEAVHAHLAARFYTCLTEAFGERGKAAFVLAVQHYGLQRGQRMAQKAIRDGKALNHLTFMEYNELIATSEVIPANRDLESLSPDYELHITNCPWHDRFLEMDCLEAGDVYCSLIDEAICRGFNPELIFESEMNLNSSAYCLHRVKNTFYEAFPDVPQKKEDAYGFDYHCGHLYWSVSEVAAAIFQADGEAVNAAVLKDFTETYGTEMADRLASFRHTNFNVFR